MSSRYLHIFFDLDRTLWDFNKNSMETLGEMYAEFNLRQYNNFGQEEFVSAYMEINDMLWDNYRKNIINKKQLRDNRFRLTFQKMGVENNELAEKISAFYLANCPMKRNLIPYTLELLEYLNGRYQLHIITNGFGDAQRKKLKNTGIEKYFKHVIISEEIGHNKPSQEIFHSAVAKVNGKMNQSIMVGDDMLVDIKGAGDAGMDQLHYNPQQEVHEYQSTYQVNCLSEIFSIL